MSERGEKLLVEPVTRSDGITIRFIQEGTSILLDADGFVSGYGREEIMRLGLGDFQTGLAKLGQAAFIEDGDVLRKAGSERLLNEILGDRK